MRHADCGKCLEVIFLVKSFEKGGRDGEGESNTETGTTTFFLSRFMTADSQWGGRVRGKLKFASN